MENNNSPTQILLRLTRSLILNDIGELKGALELSLGDVASLFSAQRVLVFQYDTDNQNFSVAFEWHTHKLPSLKPVLKKLHFREYMILGRFKANSSLLYIRNTSDLPDTYPFDSKLFRDLNCQSYIQAILSQSQRTLGFIAVMNNQPSLEWEDNYAEFLEVVGELYKILITKINELSASSRENKQEVRPMPYQALHLKQKDSLQFFEKIFGHLHYGIALYDTTFRKFVFSNKRCRELLGIESQTSLHSRDVFSIFKENGYDSQDFFSSDTRMMVKDFTITHLNRYLNGSVSPVSDAPWLVLSFTDITPIANYEKSEKEFHQQLKTLSEAAVELITPWQGKEDIFKYIGETAFLLLNNAIVIVNKYFEKEAYLKTVYVKGFGFSIDLITSLIGKHPLHKKYPLDLDSEPYRNIISTRITELRGGIVELSLGTIAEPVARKTEKILNVNRIFSCGLYAGNTLYGTISFLMRPNTQINFYVLETFSRMASNALYAFEISYKLNKTSRALTNAVTIARIGYWEYDFDTNNFTINAGVYRKIEPDGLVNPQEETKTLMLNDFLSRYIEEEDAAKIKETIAKAARNKGNENFVIDLEFKLFLPSGSAMHIYTRGMVHKSGLLIGVAQDISEIKKAEKNLWESELKFQNLVEQSLDAIIVVKDDGVITKWNPRAEEITCLSAEKVLGKYAWDIESSILYNPLLKRSHPQQSALKLKKRFFQFFISPLSRKPFSLQITIRNASGDIKYLTVTSFVFTANQNKFLCRIIKDNTLEKQKQEKEKEQEILLKTAKAKDLFLDNMSHEMRTPLSGIIGMTDILLHTRMSAQQNEMLKVVKESSDSLLELITCIHELSRLEIEGVIIQNKPFRMGMLMEKVMSIFKAVALQKSIELVLEDHSPANMRLIGDEFRIRQILGNLLGNALKFTPPGGRVDAVVNASRLNSTNMEILVEIKDTGIGIEPDKIPFLFQKFTQIDNSYTREYEGVGIGLIISRELVKLMGGQIGVNSQHRKGSVFWVKFVLPYHEA